MTTAIVQTGTTTAIVSTGTATAIVITEFVEGGGAGLAGTSQQVGVSLVDKQIREIVPQKRKLVEAQFVLQGKLLETLEIPTRVQSKLKALCCEAELVISSKHSIPLKTRMTIYAQPPANLAVRLEMVGKTKSLLTISLDVTGEKDFTDLGMLMRLAKLAD